MSDVPLAGVLARSVTVRRSIDVAFMIWTEKLDSWWPQDHLVSGEADACIVIEGRVGGRFYERTADGREYDWGTVTHWEPPRRLAYSWNRGSPVDQPTQVDVQFVALEAGRTRVDVAHHAAPAAAESWRLNSPRFAAAWAHVLPGFAAYCDLEETRDV